jgi:hypothetical protein
MALEQTDINIIFSNGNHNSTNKDSNGFWLSVGTYTTSADISANETTVDISDLTLWHNSSGMFTNYQLSVYLRAEYKLDFDPVIKYKYFFGDANGNSIGNKSMPNNTLSLLTTSQIAPVVIPHNIDGTRPDLVIRGFCDAPSNESFLPSNTQASTNNLTLPRIPRGPRVKDGNVWKNTVLYVKDNNEWKIAIPYVKDNNVWKIGGG